MVTSRRLARRVDSFLAAIKGSGGTERGFSRNSYQILTIRFLGVIHRKKLALLLARGFGTRWSP